MSRQIYQNSGLIIALVLAGVSLTFGIIGVTRESTHVDYDENYYNEYYNQTYYLNQTYYGINETEPDYTKPLETINYYNLNQYEFILRNFTLSSSYAYWYYWNASTSFSFRFWVVRAFFYESVLLVNGSSQIHGVLSNIAVHEKPINFDSGSSYYIPSFQNCWLDDNKS